MIQSLEHDREPVYDVPHDHRAYGHGHTLRVDVSIALLRTERDNRHAEDRSWRSVADLSCGNGLIAARLGLPVQYLGDLAPGYPIQGDILKTVDGIPYVDLFVCSETLEHHRHPRKVLEAIRGTAKELFLSTPIGAWNDGNPEHLWAWNRLDVEEMLNAAGWSVRLFCSLDVRPLGGTYCYGMWVCQ